MRYIPVLQFNKKIVYLVSAFFLLAVVTVIAVVDPSQCQWMPKCVFKALTGLDCPGCGATRAFHSALHGNMSEALRYNYFLVIGGVYALSAFIFSKIPAFKKTRIKSVIYGSKVAYLYIVLFFAWWIIRNLPWYKTLL